MAATVTIRVEPRTHAKLSDLAETEHRAIGEIVSEAVERYEEDRFWEAYNAAYERLYADPEALADWQQELAIYDGALMDGLEEEPCPSE